MADDSNPEYLSDEQRAARRYGKSSKTYKRGSQGEEGGDKTVADHGSNAEGIAGTLSRGMAWQSGIDPAKEPGAPQAEPKGSGWDALINKK